MNLFSLGDFVLNSGAKSRFKLECDALSEDDITCLAWMIRHLVGLFSSVEGVPRGGLRLAKALQRYKLSNEHPHLIVDDVLTTGGSMERLRAIRRADYLQDKEDAVARGDRDEYHRLKANPPKPGVIGAVIFARGPCPDWIKPLFQMPPELWVNPPTKQSHTIPNEEATGERSVMPVPSSKTEEAT